MIFIGYIETTTDKAIFFQDHYWSIADWLPRSQIDIIRSEETYEVRVIASAWICEQKKIAEFKHRTKEEIENGQQNRTN